MYTKTILAAATIVAMAASSPALAKTTHKTHKTTHHVSHNEVRPVDAYAAAYPNVRTRRANHGSNDVYDVRGHYIGTDPDAAIREQLARDPSQGD
jgi:nucleoside-specific outer membrane channel protein Tsx